MKQQVCSAIRKLQTIPVPGVSAKQFVKYMKAETRLPLPRVRRMVMLALKTGVEHDILTVDKHGFYRLQPVPVPKNTSQGATKTRGAVRGGRDLQGRARAVALSSQGQRARRTGGGSAPRTRSQRTRGKGGVSRVRKQTKRYSPKRK